MWERLYFTGPQNKAPKYMICNDVSLYDATTDRCDGDSRRENEKYGFWAVLTSN
jgi:hypothetical protein